MIPVEEFWNIMEAYATRVLPVSILLYLAGILLVGWLFLKPGRLASLLVKLYLSISFAFIAVAFYFILAKDIAGNSYGNYIIGFLFIIVSVLCILDLARNKMQFTLQKTGWQKYSTSLLMVLVFSYPLFGIVFGHKLTRLIIPGTFPCPTVALGLILLTTALPRVDRIMYIILIFCAVPFTLCMQILTYGVYEDSIMLATGIYSLVLLVRYWKQV
jgi:hypothetical protein